MSSDIFERRTEKRFLIPKGRVGELLETLQGFRLHKPEGMENTCLQSIYFGRHGEVNKKGLIRVRKYEKSELSGDILTLDRDEVVFFEIKYKNDGKIDKKRGQFSYRTVIEKLSKPEESAEWIANETGLGKIEFKTLVDEFDALELYPQFAILTNRRHYHSNKTDINCRLTVDQDIRYFAFRYGDPLTGVEMGREPMVKLEVKADEASYQLVEKITQKMIEFGGISIDTLQNKAEAMCQETIKMFGWPGPSKNTDSSIESTPMHSLRVMEGIFINEFGGKEFEMKVQVTPLEPKKLIDEIRERLLNNHIPEFSLPEDKKEVSWWIYFMDYYGYDDNGKTKIAFDVVRHPDKDKFMVQFKEDSSRHGTETAFVVARKEFKFRVERKFEKNDLETMIAYYSELVGKPIFYVGTNRRKKYYLFLFNKSSQRYYNLGVDLNNCNEQKMVQLEIEYKGKHPDSKVKDDKNMVLSEMSQLVREFKKIRGFDLRLTELRKFDWVKSIRGIK